MCVFINNFQFLSWRLALLCQSSPYTYFPPSFFLIRLYHSIGYIIHYCLHLRSKKGFSLRSQEVVMYPFLWSFLIFLEFIVFSFARCVSLVLSLWFTGAIINTSVVFSKMSSSQVTIVLWFSWWPSSQRPPPFGPTRNS